MTENVLIAWVAFGNAIISAKWSADLGFSQMRQLLWGIAGLFVGPLVLLILYLRLLCEAKPSQQRCQSILKPQPSLNPQVSQSCRTPRYSRSSSDGVQFARMVVQFGIGRNLDRPSHRAEPAPATAVALSPALRHLVCGRLLRCQTLP
jgi:hypothetical protein